MGPAAASSKASINSDLPGVRSTEATKSTREPVGVGTRTAMPSNFPFNSGTTKCNCLRGARAGRYHVYGGRPRAAQIFMGQVENLLIVGIAVDRRHEIPGLIPKASLTTLAAGAKQLVVQDAFDKTSCDAGS